MYTREKKKGERGRKTREGERSHRVEDISLAFFREMWSEIGLACVVGIYIYVYVYVVFRERYSPAARTHYIPEQTSSWLTCVCVRVFIWYMLRDVAASERALIEL